MAAGANEHARRRRRKPKGTHARRKPSKGTHASRRRKQAGWVRPKSDFFLKTQFQRNTLQPPFSEISGKKNNNGAASAARVYVLFPSRIDSAFLSVLSESRLCHQCQIRRHKSQFSGQLAQDPEMWNSSDRRCNACMQPGSYNAIMAQFHPVG